MEENKDLNRIKVMLAEKKRTNKCSQSNLVSMPPQLVSGVPILPSRLWIC